MNDIAAPSWQGKLPSGYNTKKPFKLSSDFLGLTEIYGEDDNRIVCYTYISTKDVHSCLLVTPPGQSFQPPDLHTGDESYYILEGEAHVLNPETGQLVLAKEGSLIFIPRKTWHQIYNFSDREVKIIAMITGTIWEQKDMEMVENRNFKSVYYEKNMER